MKGKKLSKFTRFIRHQQRVRHAVYQTESNIKRAVWRTAGVMLGLVFLHTSAMVYLEGMNFWQGLWLTLTTITTVGFGDLSPQTIAGQAATISLIYICGITLMTFLISDYVDFRIARREKIRTGHWNWNMEEHILIINAPKYNCESYFIRLISQIRENTDYAETPIQLLNVDFPEGLPDSIRGLGAVHVNGTPSNPADLKRAGADRAKHIVVLARNEYTSDSDSFTFDVAHRLNELHVCHKTIIECVIDDNRPRMRELGVKSVLRPIRSYPEIIVRSMDAPGSEVIIEDMFTRANDHPHRYPVWLEGEPWADIVNALIQANLGTALGFVTKEGDVVAHPKGDEHVHAQSLIVLVKTEFQPEEKQVTQALEDYFQKQISVNRSLHESEVDENSDDALDNNDIKDENMEHAEIEQDHSIQKENDDPVR
ncbi:MAG TPA: two pore domain potassium channel family protein [Oceanospirillales bacterium]|nr:two pore domain potassium channel family protein [Oceanospirillales bacterium]